MLRDEVVASLVFGVMATFIFALVWGRQFVDLLERHGLRPRPAPANFVLVAGATGLRSRLAQSGVVVRDCTSFGLPDHVRVAVPDADGLHRLDAALEETDDR